MAGPVAEGTTPVTAAGGSLLLGPLATWMLIGVAVNARSRVDGYGFAACKNMVEHVFGWMQGEIVSGSVPFQAVFCMDGQDGRDF